MNDEQFKSLMDELILSRKELTKALNTIWDKYPQ